MLHSVDPTFLALGGQEQYEMLGESAVGALTSRIRARKSGESLPFGEKVLENWAVAMLSASHFSVRQQGWRLVDAAGLKSQKVREAVMDFVARNRDQISDTRTSGVSLSAIGLYLRKAFPDQSQGVCAILALGLAGAVYTEVNFPFDPYY